MYLALLLLCVRQWHYFGKSMSCNHLYHSIFIALKFCILLTDLPDIILIIAIWNWKRGSKRKHEREWSNLINPYKQFLLTLEEIQQAATSRLCTLIPYKAMAFLYYQQPKGFCHKWAAIQGEHIYKWLISRNIWTNTFHHWQISQTDAKVKLGSQV